MYLLFFPLRVKKWTIITHFDAYRDIEKSISLLDHQSKVIIEELSTPVAYLYKLVLPFFILHKKPFLVPAMVTFSSQPSQETKTTSQIIMISSTSPVLGQSLPCSSQKLVLNSLLRSPKLVLLANIA